MKGPAATKMAGKDCDMHLQRPNLRNKARLASKVSTCNFCLQREPDPAQLLLAGQRVSSSCCSTRIATDVAKRIQRAVGT